MISQASHPNNVQARNIAKTLFFAQSLGSAGYIASATVATIVGAELSGRDVLAGLPGALGSLGAALAAFLIGLSLDRLGRRLGMATGVFIGLIGAVIAGLAIIQSSFILYLVGFVLIGFTQASVRFGRFIAAEVFVSEQRGRAVSFVVLGGTVGAILGPLLVGPTGRLAKQFGISELAGPYSAMIVLYALTVLLLYVFLRPDPKTLAIEIALAEPKQTSSAAKGRSMAQLFKSPGVLAAMGAMVFGQAVMLTVMVITALHMRYHDHSLGNISIVFAMHTLGMYAPSIFSGWLTDRWGRSQIILLGAALLILACLSAPLSHQLVPLALALLLLGLGWNFCYVGGSTLLADELAAPEKVKMQGFNDLLLAFISALGSFGSGFIYAQFGYAALGLIGAVVAVIPVLLVVRWNQLRLKPVLGTAN